MNNADTHASTSYIVLMPLQTSLAIIYLSCWFNFSGDLCFVMMTIIGWSTFFCLCVVNKCSLIIALFFVIISRKIPSVDRSDSHILRGKFHMKSKQIPFVTTFHRLICATMIYTYADVLIPPKRKIQHIKQSIKISNARITRLIHILAVFCFSPAALCVTWTFRIRTRRTQWRSAGELQSSHYVYTINWII